MLEALVSRERRGDFGCLRVHLERFKGSIRKQAAKERNVDISENFWTSNFNFWHRDHFLYVFLI